MNIKQAWRNNEWIMLELEDGSYAHLKDIEHLSEEDKRIIYNHLERRKKLEDLNL